MFLSERRSLTRFVSAVQLDRVWAFLRISELSQLGGPQWSNGKSATVTHRDRSETDLDSWQKNVSESSQNYKLSNDRVQDFYWAMGAASVQKTEMNQGDANIRLIEEKMLDKSVHSVSPNLTEKMGGSQKSSKDASRREKHLNAAAE